MWNFIKSAYRWISELVQAYTLLAALIPTTLVTAMTAYFASHANEPWHLVILYSIQALCFTILAIGGFFWARIYHDDAKQRFNPHDKLKIEPAYWFAKNTSGEKNYLTEMQLGLIVHNQATFPIVHRVTNLSTTFDEIHKTFNNFPWKDDELAGQDYREDRDGTLIFKQKKKMGSYQGHIEYSIQYWKTGSKKTFTKSEKLVLEFRFDLQNPSMTSRRV